MSTLHTVAPAGIRIISFLQRDGLLAFLLKPCFTVRVHPWHLAVRNASHCLRRVTLSVPKMNKQYPIFEQLMLNIVFNLVNETSCYSELYQGATVPGEAGHPHCWGFMIKLIYTTLGRTLLDECSARRRDLYLTTHNNRKRQTFMPSEGFETGISTSERPHTHALGRAGLC